MQAIYFALGFSIETPTMVREDWKQEEHQGAWSPERRKYTWRRSKGPCMRDWDVECRVDEGILKDAFNAMQKSLWTTWEKIYFGGGFDVM